MLIIAKCLNDLNFVKLMDVYREGNLENGKYFFPDEPEHRQLMLAEDSFRAYLRDDFFRHRDAFYFVWEEGESYVSALRLEPYEDGFLLEALETHSDHRQKGFAKRLIKEAVNSFPKGTKIYSHVSKKNVASLKTHHSCGFYKIFDYAREIDGTVTSNHITLLLIR